MGTTGFLRDVTGLECFEGGTGLEEPVAGLGDIADGLGDIADGLRPGGVGLGFMEGLDVAGLGLSPVRIGPFCKHADIPVVAA